MEKIALVLTVLLPQAYPGACGRETLHPQNCASGRALHVAKRTGGWKLPVDTVGVTVPPTTSLAPTRAREVPLLLWCDFILLQRIMVSRLLHLK